MARKQLKRRQTRRRLELFNLRLRFLGLELLLPIVFFWNPGEHTWLFLARIEPWAFIEHAKYTAALHVFLHVAPQVFEHISQASRFFFRT